MKNPTSMCGSPQCSYTTKLSVNLDPCLKP